MATEQSLHALEALQYSGAFTTHYDEHYCEEDDPHGDGPMPPTPAFAKAAGYSKDGRDIIIRMTPSQVLRFCDMIAQELD